MLQERQHRWTEIEELCTFTIVTDSLYANMPKKSRRSSLQKALADVASLTLSAPISGTINEDIIGEMVESTSSASNLNRSTFDVNRKLSRDNSFDNSSGASSSVGSSRQPSIVSTVSSNSATQQDAVEINSKNSPQNQQSPKQHKANANGQATTITSTHMRKVSSEKFGHSVSLTENSSNTSSRPVEKRLHRVNTEPVGMSRRAMTNALNGRHRNSGEFNHQYRHSAHSIKSSSSKDRISVNVDAGKMFTTQSEEDVSSNNFTATRGTTSNLSLDKFNDDKYEDDVEDLDDFEDDYDDEDNISIQASTQHTDNGQLSDGSMTSSASVTSTSIKKKKKGIHGLKKIFHRKQKEDR